MSLYPGAPRLDENNRHVLDDLALQRSMALAIEEAMNDVFQKVKGTPVPEVGKEDRRLLFVAVSRGVLQYLESHQVTMNTTLAANGGPPRTGSIDLRVTMDRHLTHISLQLSLDQITPGGTSDGTLELSDPAPQGGANVTLSADRDVVTLSSDDVNVPASNPLSVKVPEGQRTAQFKVQALQQPPPPPPPPPPPAIDVRVTITASVAGGVTQTARLRVFQR